MKKALSIMLLLCTILFGQTGTAFADDNVTLKYSYANTAEITAQMDILKKYLPSGKYWNGNKTESELKNAALKGDFSASAMGITSSGCRWKSKKNKSPSGYLCTSNTFGGGTQCYGFANFVGWLLFPDNGIPTSKWAKVSGNAAKSHVLEPGDIVRFGGHSGIVWKISDGKVYLAQVWGNNGTGDVGGKNYEQAKGCPIQWTTWESNSNYDTNAELVNAVAKDSDGFILKHPLLYVDNTPRIATATASIKLYSTASTDSTVKETVNKNTVLYIDAKVNDDWYRTEDGTFVQTENVSKNISIKVANASFSDVEKISAIGTVKTSDGYLKYKPFEAADHLDGGTVAKGKSVTIIGKVTNSYGNIWYVTDKGYYIYSGDVSFSADLFNIRAGFKTTEKTTSRAEPFNDAPAVKTIDKGTMFVAFKFVTNSEGDIWAQLDEATDNYVCFYDASKDKIMLDFVHVAQNTTVDGFPTSSSDSGYPGYPTGDRDPKTSCALRGTIKSVAPMLSIEARVTNLSTNKKVLSVIAQPKYDLRSAKINADITNRDGSKTNINNKMSFSKVADDGYYVYEIAVQLGFVYEGKTFKFGTDTVVFKSNFTIGDTTSAGGSLVEPEEPSLGDVVEPVRVPGDVNEDGKVNSLDAQLTMKYAAKWAVTINLSNADVNADGKVSSADALMILKYAAKWNVVLK